MSFPTNEIDELKKYCTKVSAFSERGVTFLVLEGLQLPQGCQPMVCDALLCPTAIDGYPSRLYFSVQVGSPYTRNWNAPNVRIGEKNWFGFSWKVTPPSPALPDILRAHLTGFARAE